MGNEEIVRLLIDVGHARVNIVDHDGQTAIVYAAKWGRAAVARLLIERRAFQTVLCDRHGALTPTALMVAASVGNEEIVRLLIGAGHALVNIVDTNGQTALMYAAKSGKDAVADLLIEHGAKTALCDRHGARASNLARAAGYLELAQHLAEHASVESLRAKIAYWWEKRS